MKVYNGEGMVLGRLATQAAKDLLLGEEVKVVNCDKIVISGKKTNTFTQERKKRLRKGYPLKSNKLSRVPEMFVKRTIRGMLPWKQSRGREAFKQLRCYQGVPEDLNNQKMISMEKASVKKLPNLQYITVKEVCQQLGGKVE